MQLLQARANSNMWASRFLCPSDRAKRAFFSCSWIPAPPFGTGSPAQPLVVPSVGLQPGQWDTRGQKADLEEVAISGVQDFCLHTSILSLPPSRVCPFVASDKRNVNEQSLLSLCCLDS